LKTELPAQKVACVREGRPPHGYSLVNPYAVRIAPFKVNTPEGSGLSGRPNMNSIGMVLT
jgi:hypothetical protein